MATIQIKRRTSAGSGPLIGTSGVIKAGEPLVDLNDGHLYIARSDKTASSSNPINELDYLALPSVDRVDDQITAKINDLSLGTASKKNTGTSSGNVPVLDANGKLSDSVIPKVAITNTFVVASQVEMLALSTAQEGDVAIRTDLNKSFILRTTGYSTLANWQELLTPTDKVTSVNGKTGTVTISLSELGGVSTSTYNSHVASDVHLTETQKQALTNMHITNIYQCDSATYLNTKEDVNTNSIEDAIIFTANVDASYKPKSVTYYLGIDKSKVLHPASIIDGGTY